MTIPIAAVLFILLVALVLFITEKLRMDVVALLVMSALGITGLVQPEDVIAGFSDPAVITVWSMFILSAGLSLTGVADIIGRQVLKLAGTNEPRMILVIMLTTGIMSGIMNNIGVAALMLPVVMDIARRTKTPPSRLLMPMAYASLLGGLTTLVGTPPNLVASGALVEAGEEPFTLFEFAPIGVPALIVGSLFVAFIGRHILPSKMPDSYRESEGDDGSPQLRVFQNLEDHRFQLRLSEDSPLHDRPILDSHLDDMLGLQVFSIERDGEIISEVTRDTILKSRDLLTVQGRLETVQEFLRWNALEMGHGREILDILGSKKLMLLSATIAPGAEIAGLTVREADFSRRFDGFILTIRRNDKIHREGFAEFVFQEGDVIQIETRTENVDRIKGSPQLTNVELISEESLDQIYPTDSTLIGMDVPDDSRVVGMKITDTGFAKLRLRILGIARRGGSKLIPSSSEVIEKGDKLLIHGSRDVVTALRQIKGMELIANDEATKALTNEDGYTEVTLAPQSDLVGKTLRELRFRNRYGLHVLAIWRKGKAITAHLRNMSLEFGDALLLTGSREKIEALSKDDNFLVLSHSAYDESDSRKTPAKSLLAAVLMLAVVGVVLAGLLPIAIAAVAGATLMVVFRCMNIEEAYRSIEWKSVFLIACMIPLGAAMKDTGAAKWLGDGVASVAGPFGPWGMIIALYVMTALATTIVPTAALVLIMANIGMDAAATMDMDPRMVVMAIAMAASASFTSPISHPANVLVMGPGGYRFVDYIKMGLLLALVVALTVLPLLAWWTGRAS